MAIVGRDHLYIIEGILKIVAGECDPWLLLIPSCYGHKSLIHGVDECELVGRTKRTQRSFVFSK